MEALTATRPICVHPFWNRHDVQQGNDLVRLTALFAFLLIPLNRPQF